MRGSLTTGPEVPRLGKAKPLKTLGGTPAFSRLETLLPR